jgi:nucleotide-binding universal stress UspA family protein
MPSNALWGIDDDTREGLLMDTKVLACVDHSNYALSVCDHAAWAAAKLGAPLELLHVLDRHPETASAADLSGNIGLGARESLLAELAQLDEQRSRLAQERGRTMLEALKMQAQQAGVAVPAARQRHGELAESLHEIEAEARLFVLGKRGESARVAEQHLGRSLERVVRSLHKPILVVPLEFTAPHDVLIAFDGSATTHKGVELIAGSPLFVGLPCHVLIAGPATSENERHLEWARSVLAAGGIEASASIVPGQPDAVLNADITARSVSLLVMGAYGHSRVRQLLVGSTTTTIIRTTQIPVLLLR